MTAPSSRCPSLDQLRQMLAGELDSPQTEALATHLETCQICQQRAEVIESEEAPAERFEIEEDVLPYADESQCGRLIEQLAARSPQAGGTSPGGGTTVRAPERLGDYELLSRLGEGGMGTVYRACHRTTGTPAAVKILHPQRRLDHATIERFEREMVALGRLDHPNIVRALDAGHDDGQHYLVMEYVDGTDLGQILRSRGPLPIAEAAEAARQAALGLAYVHDNGRVHRDVKPSNLMVASDGTVKLLDLGLARVEEFPVDEPLGGTDDILGGSTLELTRTHQVMGTLDYMAPEQASDSRSVDHRADIYALGCTLYKLLTGHSPFACSKSISALSQVLAHVETPAPPVTHDRPDVPEGLAKLLDRILAKKPDDRPQTAGEVAAALAPYTQGADLSSLVSEHGTVNDATSMKAAAPTMIGDSGERHDLSRTEADHSATPPRRSLRLRRSLMSAAALLLVGAGLWAAFWSPLSVPPEATLLVEASTPEASVALSRSNVTISGSHHTQPIQEGKNAIPAGRYLISFDNDSRLQFSQRDFHLDPDEQLVLAVSLSSVPKIEPGEPEPESKHDASAPGIRAVELIPLIDPQRDIRGDDWRVEGNALVSHADQPSMLLIPYRPPDEYRVELTATRLRWAESLQLGLVAGGRPLILAIDAHPGNGSLSGPYLLDSQGLLNRSAHVHRGQVLPEGRAVRLSATVRRTGSRVSVDLQADGRPLTSWRGSVSDASATGSFPLPEEGVLFLGNWTASIRIDDLRVTPLSGDGEVVHFTDPQRDRVRAAMERAVWKGGTLSVQVDGVMRTIDGVADVQSLPVDSHNADGALTSFLKKFSDTQAVASRARLIAIDMQQSRWLRDEDLAFFADLPHLQTLDLEKTSITEAGLNRLGTLPLLKTLLLSRTGVRALPESLARQMPSLRMLDLHQTPVQALPEDLLEQLASLEALNLSATPVREAISRLSSLGGLQELNLSQTSISTDELAALPAAPRLATLNLAGTRIDSLESITAERFPALTRLDVLDTPVGGEDVDRITQTFGERADSVTDRSPASTSEPVDVLGVIDISRDAARWETAWTRSAEGFFHTQPKSRTVLPIELPLEFDLEMTAVALKPLNSTIFGLALPDGTHFSVGFDHTPEKGKQAILHWIDGKYQEQSPERVPLETFAVGQPATIRISVRGTGEQIEITALKDDQPVLEWTGDRSRLDVTNPWWLGPITARPWISQFDGVLEIRDLTVTPVSGEAKLPTATSGFEIVSSYGPIDLISMIDTERDAGKGRWTRQAGVLQAPSQTRLLLPVYLPPEFEIEMLVRKPTAAGNGGNGPQLELPLPDGTRVMVGFDHWPIEDGYTIIHGIDGKMERESLVKEPGMVLSEDAAQPARLMVRVEGTGTQIRVSAHVDGIETVAWDGERTRMRPKFYGNPHDPRRPTIGQFVGAVEISELTLTPLSGRVELPSFGPSYADPDRDVAEWVLAHGGTVKVPLVEGQPWNMQQYRPGDELPVQAFWIGEIRNLQNQALPTEWLAKVGQLKGLLRLDLSRTDFDNSDLAPLADIQTLQDFMLDGSTLNDEGLSHIARVPNLKLLHISQTALTSTGIQALEDHPSIVRLNVARLPIDDTVCAVAATMPLLEELRINRTEVTGDGLQRLQEIPNLRALGLHDCPRLTESDIQHLARLPRLQWLGITQNELGPSAMEPVGQIRGLTFLDLWRNPIGDEGIEHLTELRNLTELRVGATGITDDAIETISSFTRLEVLDLPGNPEITDVSVEPLTRLGQLRELHLDGTRVTPQGIARLSAALPNCRVHASAARGRDDTLDLRESGIADEELAQALQGRFPATLILEGPGITDRSIPTILSRPALSRLALYGTRITEAGIGRLAALSNLRRIEFWNMPQISSEVTAHLVKFPNLTHVVFKSSGVYGPGLPRLHGTGIDSLNIGHQKLNGEVLEQYILPFEQLWVLDLAGARIHDDDVALLKQMTISGNLHLGYNANIKGPGLIHIKEMPQLRALNLDASGVDDAGLKHLAGAQQLERLILRKTAVSDESVELIASLTGLNEVHLNETNFTPTGIARLRLARPDCRVLSDFDANDAVSGTLELTDSDVDDEGLAALLAELTPRKLILRGPGFTDESIPTIRKQSGLVSLALFNTNITEQGVGQLADLSTLEEIQFWNMPQITGEVTRHLARLPNLQVVIFKGTGVYGPGLERLHQHDLRKVAIGHASTDRAMLETYVLPFGPTPNLDLADTGIRDEDVALLQSMEPRWLHLGFNANITGPGLTSLKEIPSLKILLLDSATLDDAGFAHLAGAQNLERLYLRKVPITDASVATLTTLSNLKVLDINGTGISEEGIARIQDAMPRLRLWAEGLNGVDATYPPRHAERVVELGMRPSFSADGTQLVYGLPEGAGLRVLDLESGADRSLHERGKDARWSPDGEWIAFIKERRHNSGDGVLAVVRPDGTDLQTFEPAHYPFWLAGSEQLAYYSRPARGLLMRNVERPKAPTPFHPQTPSFFCDATSDGRYLAFGSEGVLRVIDRQTGDAAFSRRFEDSTGTGLPAFSPDGRYLAYNAWGTPEAGIWVFDWQSGREVELCPGNYAAPAWSPDGRRLAFDFHTGGARHEIWIMDLTDRLPQPLSE